MHYKQRVVAGPHTEGAHTAGEGEPFPLYGRLSLSPCARFAGIGGESPAVLLLTARGTLTAWRARAPLLCGETRSRRRIVPSSGEMSGLR